MWGPEPGVLGQDGEGKGAPLGKLVTEAQSPRADGPAHTGSHDRLR